MRRATRVLAGVAAAAAATVAVLAPAAPAGAHSELRSSNPAAGARVDRLPGVVRLDFNQVIGQEFLTVRLTRATDGQVFPLEGTAKAMTVSARVPAAAREPGRPSGAGPGWTSWRLVYRVVSADGHPITGAVPFRARTPQPATAESSAPSPGEASPSDATGETTSSSPSQSDELAVTSDEAGGGGTGTVIAFLVIAVLVASAALGVVAWLTRARAQASREQP